MNEAHIHVGVSGLALSCSGNFKKAQVNNLD